MMTPSEFQRWLQGYLEGVGVKLTDEQLQLIALRIGELQPQGIPPFIPGPCVPVWPDPWQPYGPVCPGPGPLAPTITSVSFNPDPDRGES